MRLVRRRRRRRRTGRRLAGRRAPGSASGRLLGGHGVRREAVELGQWPTYLVLQLRLVEMARGEFRLDLGQRALQQPV